MFKNGSVFTVSNIFLFPTQVRPICRPGKYQRQVYNGHKRVHALKYQSVVAANGLIVHMHGPVGMFLGWKF
jgi:hypothetical protein